MSATTAQYGDEVTFSCVVDEGCEFKGWYSDEGLTQLVSNQTSYSYTVTSDITLYPKIEIIIYTVSTTGIFLKRNSSWMEAKSAYRKVNGAWVADTDYCKTLLSQKDRIGTFVHIV